MRRRILVFFTLFLFSGSLLSAGCAHYPINEPLKQYDPNSGYRAKFIHTPSKSDELQLYLTFSGGGIRAAAFTYGVLETLRDTEVSIGGKKHRLLDEIDVISAVSGGSFTRGYLGLFGDRIFEDFETRFLKKNIQGILTANIFLYPVNWGKLLSPWYDRSDLAAEYYDKHVFDGGTFGDIAARKGPMILINATDMVTGIRIGFSQDDFDIFCSDLTHFPVARAAAASSAVPILLTPIAIRNYAGTCGYEMPTMMEEVLRKHDTSSRQYLHVQNLLPYLDSEKKRYIHLVDGGVADNLGLRAAIDRVLTFGDAWDALKLWGATNVHKFVFIVVNAETEVSPKWYLFDKPPTFFAMLDSYASVSIARYNFETVMLLKESFRTWTEEIAKEGAERVPYPQSREPVAIYNFISSRSSSMNYMMRLSASISKPCRPLFICLTMRLTRSRMPPTEYLPDQKNFSAS